MRTNRVIASLRFINIIILTILRSNIQKTVFKYILEESSLSKTAKKSVTANSNIINYE